MSAATRSMLVDRHNQDVNKDHSGLSDYNGMQFDETYNDERGIVYGGDSSINNSEIENNIYTQQSLRQTDKVTVKEKPDFSDWVKNQANNKRVDIGIEDADSSQNATEQSLKRQNNLEIVSSQQRSNSAALSDDYNFDEKLKIAQKRISMYSGVDD